MESVESTNTKSQVTTKRLRKILTINRKMISLLERKNKRQINKYSHTRVPIISDPILRNK